jgi:hypothetical protein
MFRDAWDAWADLLVANLLWLLLTALVVTAPPALAGLYYATNEAAHRRAGGWSAFFEGFRRLFWLGWRWALLNLVAIAGLVANLVFYRGIDAGWAAWAQGIYIGLAAIWFALQVYTFPLLLEQSDRRLLVALRNSLVLYLKQPRFSLATTLMLALFLAASTYLKVPWLLFTASLSAFIANRSVLIMLDRIQPGARP